MNDKTINTLVNGVDDSISAEAKRRLEASMRTVVKDLEDAKANRSSTAMFKAGTNIVRQSGSSTDAEIYTNLSEMINGTNTDVGGFGTVLENLYGKNRKYFSIIKDYEMMPILIPQINRVLMFLVNECLSPDIQNSSTFNVKYVAANDPARVQDDIDAIKKEMKLDSLLREVYTNRYKLGREYYTVIDYNQTFNHMMNMIEQKKLNEDTEAMSDLDYLEHTYQVLRTTVNESTTSIRIHAIGENGTAIEEAVANLNFANLNIQVYRSPISELMEEAHAELLHETYSNYRVSSLMSRMVSTGSLNEAVTDTSKLTAVVEKLRNKKLQRCTIDRLDPARVFKLKIGGKVIGYFYLSDLSENTGLMVNFAQSLKDQLVKSRATNLNAATKTAEEVIAKDLAERIINAFDPNIGINRIEDIDLLHNFIRENEVYKGNKRITFYYDDEIFDMSRADDSILTNGVFFTKLYSTLLLNNICTKVLRGRGRQIHTVRTGASPNIQRYIQNAMAALTMPENNLGTLHGSFEQILNPFNSASDIIIPTDDDNAKYIETDYIPGQDVNMDDDFLKTLLNAIVSSFGLDAAVIDATNGNLQFARTLTMESLQISNNIKNEQQDLHDAWEAMCLRVFSIMGTDDTKQAVEDGKIVVEFFEPKSLILQNTIDDLNNAKSFAESIADIIPEFNEEGTELNRSKFIFNIVKNRTNIDWSEFENTLTDTKLSAVGDQIDANIRRIVREYMENMKEEQYGDHNGDGFAAPGEESGDDQYGGYRPEDDGTEEPGSEEAGTEGEDLTAEEQDLMAEDEDFDLD